jgi:hypothetical protein
MGGSRSPVLEHSAVVSAWRADRAVVGDDGGSQMLMQAPIRWWGVACTTAVVALQLSGASHSDAPIVPCLNHFYLQSKMPTPTSFLFRIVLRREHLDRFNALCVP